MVGPQPTSSREALSGMTDEERSTWFCTLRRDEDPNLAGQLEILLREHRELSQEAVF